MGSPSDTVLARAEAAIRRAREFAVEYSRIRNNAGASPGRGTLPRAGPQINGNVTSGPTAAGSISAAGTAGLSPAPRTAGGGPCDGGPVRFLQVAGAGSEAGGAPVAPHMTGTGLSGDTPASSIDGTIENCPGGRNGFNAGPDVPLAGAGDDVAALERARWHRESLPVEACIPGHAAVQQAGDAGAFPGSSSQSCNPLPLVCPGSGPQAFIPLPHVPAGISSQAFMPLPQAPAETSSQAFSMPLPQASGGSSLQPFMPLPQASGGSSLQPFMPLPQGPAGSSILQATVPQPPRPTRPPDDLGDDIDPHRQRSAPFAPRAASSGNPSGAWQPGFCPGGLVQPGGGTAAGAGDHQGALPDGVPQGNEQLQQQVQPWQGFVPAIQEVREAAACLSRLRTQQEDTISQLRELRREQLSLRWQQLSALRRLLTAELALRPPTPSETEVVDQMLGALSLSLDELHSESEALTQVSSLQIACLESDAATVIDRRACHLSRLCRQLLGLLRRGVQLVGEEGPRGASDAQLASLPVSVLLDDSPLLGEACPICLACFAAGHVVTSLQCAHYHHRSCLGEWLSIKAECPLCKTHLTPQPQAAADQSAADTPAA